MNVTMYFDSLEMCEEMINFHMMMPGISATALAIS